MITINVDKEGTKITDEDGKEIKDIYSIDIRMRVAELITAEIGVHVNEISIKTNPLLTFRTVKECADYYGYDLVVKEK